MEQITLDMIPNSHTPTAHISQYDSGRHIRFNLQNITLTGSETVTLKIRKTDGELVSKTIENHTSYVEYVSEKADCDVSGKANCEIVISKDDVVIGSKNFILNIEADPYDDAGVVTETASGRIATFETNMADVLQSVKCEINATGGNGTPDNPNPINGYTEANITRCGVNLWDEQWELGTFSWTTGEKLPTTNRIRSKNKIKVSPNTEYFISSDNAIEILYYRADGSYIKNVNRNNQVFTTPEDCEWMNINDTTTATYRNNISINSPSTDTQYHSYTGNTYTIAFGQAVYGGVLDVTRGKLSVTWTIIDLGDETLNYSYNSAYHRFDCSNDLGAKPAPDNNTPANALCSCYKSGSVSGVGEEDNFFYIAPASGNGKLRVVDTDYSDVASFKNAVSGQKVAFELATPFDIDLTPRQIEALLGVNNVWHDGNGNTEVKYLYNA